MTEIKQTEKRVTCMACMGDKYKKRHCKHCQGKGYVAIVHYGLPADASQRRM